MFASMQNGENNSNYMNTRYMIRGYTFQWKMDEEILLKLSFHEVDISVASHF